MRYRTRYWSSPVWAPYVPVAQRRANAAREAARWRKRGGQFQPVWIEGRKIAQSFWGAAWCTHLESLSDYHNRLPRGRTYVRNGSVIDLQIRPGVVESRVSGSSIYTIRIQIERLPAARWKKLVKHCSGHVGSVIDLLQGRFADSVMQILVDPGSGLFPSPREIAMSCSCPDDAVLCKHVAATLYGVGSRLDQEPELLFRLRQVDGADLIAAATSGNVSKAAIPTATTLGGEDLAAVFGIELDPTPVAKAKRPKAKAKAPRAPRPG